MISLPLSDGRHSIRASIEQKGVALAAATATIWAGMPPEEDESSDMPFIVNRTDKPMEPRWRLEPPRATSEVIVSPTWVLA